MPRQLLEIRILGTLFEAPEDIFREIRWASVHPDWFFWEVFDVGLELSTIDFRGWPRCEGFETYFQAFHKRGVSFALMGELERWHWSLPFQCKLFVKELERRFMLRVAAGRNGNGSRLLQSGGRHSRRDER